MGASLFFVLSRKYLNFELAIIKYSNCFFESCEQTR